MSGIAAEVEPREREMASYEERIRSSRAALSPSFVRLADFLLDSYAEAVFLTATELAHTLDIDPATVVRFAQKLGYQGYPDLQREIRQRVKRELLVNGSAAPDSVAGAAEVALEELVRGLELTRRSFPKEAAQTLITALDKAERVILLAEGLAQAPARSLAAWLEAAGYSVHLAGGRPPNGHRWGAPPQPAPGGRPGVGRGLGFRPGEDAHACTPRPVRPP